MPLITTVNLKSLPVAHARLSSHKGTQEKVILCFDVRRKLPIVLAPHPQYRSAVV